jgi:hypothetical protein
MPKKSSRNEQMQLAALQQAALGKCALVCIDDIWASEHVAPFSCIDSATSSRLLLTTRIKGLMSKSSEVVLELLGLQASVELLANIAELDTDQVPPVLLEIAQLCGREYRAHAKSLMWRI